jgi:hypothetical protein
MMHPKLKDAWLFKGGDDHALVVLEMRRMEIKVCTRLRGYRMM